MQQGKRITVEEVASVLARPSSQPHWISDGKHDRADISTEFRRLWLSRVIDGKDHARPASSDYASRTAWELYCVWRDQWLTPMINTGANVIEVNGKHSAEDLVDKLSVDSCTDIVTAGDPFDLLTLTVFIADEDKLKQDTALTVEVAGIVALVDIDGQSISQVNVVRVWDDACTTVVIDCHSEYFKEARETFWLCLAVKEKLEAMCQAKK